MQGDIMGVASVGMLLSCSHLTEGVQYREAGASYSGSLSIAR